MANLATLQFTGNRQQVEQMLNRLNTAISPVALASFLGVKVDPYIRQRAQNRFASEGDGAVGKWAPLAPATQEIRANLGYGPTGPINKRTGELENYIVNAPHTLFADAMGATLIMPGEAPGNPTLKNKVKVAQKGAKRTPARPVMGVDETDLGFVLTALALNITHGGI